MPPVLMEVEILSVIFQSNYYFIPGKLASQGFSTNLREGNFV